MRLSKLQLVMFTCVLLGSLLSNILKTFAQTAQTQAVAVAPQYDSTHVYVAPEDMDRFVVSFLGTLEGRVRSRLPPR